MLFQQFRHEEGHCLSYIIACTRKQVCAIIDSQLEIEPYLKFASERNLNITHIFETHSQSDHLSGAKKLAEATGAEVFFHDSVKANFPVNKVMDGDEIQLGRISLKILHTPGHTPDSICLLVTDTTRSQEPWFALTGDTLFVGDIGRPDLDGDAGQLYDSLWSKLLTLDDSVEIYPTHYAGSVCGRSMSPKPVSTIGFERRFNQSLQVQSRKEFIDFVTANLPLQPPRFRKVREFNLGFLKEPPVDKIYDVKDLQITAAELKQKMEAKDQFLLLDIREPWEREAASLGGKFIPMGQIPARLKELDSQQEIIVYCHHGNRSQRVVEFLYESGFTRSEEHTSELQS